MQRGRRPGPSASPPAEQGQDHERAGRRLRRPRPSPSPHPGRPHRGSACVSRRGAHPPCRETVQALSPAAGQPGGGTGSSSRRSAQVKPDPCQRRPRAIYCRTERSPSHGSRGADGSQAPPGRAPARSGASRPPAGAQRLSAGELRAPGPPPCACAAAGGHGGRPGRAALRPAGGGLGRAGTAASGAALSRSGVAVGGGGRSLSVPPVRRRDLGAARK